MNEYLLKYAITPRVVKADSMQTIMVKGLDESCRFYDDMDYRVTLTPLSDGWDYFEGREFVMRGRDNSKTITCHSVDGVLSISYFFKGEDQWKITIAPGSDKHIPPENAKYGWTWRTSGMMAGFHFCVYSLYDDLYTKRPYKGDLHVHTCRSDGDMGPMTVAAQYRRGGFDFLAITDHYMMQPSLDAIEGFRDIDTALKIFPGEEVHPVSAGIFHVVNFNGKSSVNQRAYDQPEKTRQEVEQIAAGLDIEDSNTRMEVAWFQWISQAIREAGGISIYAHPYWTVFDSYVVRQPVSDEVLRRGMFDAYEYFGGNPHKINRMQAQLYYQHCTGGKKVPIVGSSDSHCALAHGREDFDNTWTIVFAENVEKIPENILAGNTVAVDNLNVEDRDIFGDLRLVKYAWFLTENYYYTHDSLCDSAGQAILRHVLGHSGQEALIGQLEAEIKKFDVSFFGTVGNL